MTGHRVWFDQVWGPINNATWGAASKDVREFLWEQIQVIGPYTDLRFIQGIPITGEQNGAPYILR
tara:strand:+ start:58681 stop:58875 length:195 start_codon:yes stop_codon:yes gene_type:complete